MTIPPKLWISFFKEGGTRTYSNAGVNVLTEVEIFAIWTQSHIRPLGDRPNRPKTQTMTGIAGVVKSPRIPHRPKVTITPIMDQSM